MSNNIFVLSSADLSVFHIRKKSLSLLGIATSPLEASETEEPVDGAGAEGISDLEMSAEAKNKL